LASGNKTDNTIGKSKNIFPWKASFSMMKVMLLLAKLVNFQNTCTHAFYRARQMDIIAAVVLQI
jgi:hypothetical protein